MSISILTIEKHSKLNWLGNKNFTKDWLRDDTGNNISYKNKNYGEYTFHYWLWKNYINKLDDEWIGFCQYRKFWTNENYDKSKLNIKINVISSFKE